MVWAMGNGASGGGTGCRRPTEVGTGIFAVEQKNKVLCFNYLCAHRPLDCPQILRRRLMFFINFFTTPAVLNTCFPFYLFLLLVTCVIPFVKGVPTLCDPVC